MLSFLEGSFHLLTDVLMLLNVGHVANVEQYANLDIQGLLRIHVHSAKSLCGCDCG